MATAYRRRVGFPATVPKFFKIIWDPQADSLRIPAVFEQRYGDILPKSVFLMVPSGSLLEVELIHSNGETWLHKGWREFTERYSIGFGNLLVFQYDGKSQFDVLVFDATALEIEYPFSANHDQVPEIVGNGTDSDDSVVFLGEIVTNKNRLSKEETRKDLHRRQSDVCVEILNDPLPRQQKRSKRRHSDDMDDFSDDFPMGALFGGMCDLSSSLKNDSGSKFSYPEELGDCSRNQSQDRVEMQGVIAQETCIANQKALAFKLNHNFQDPFFIRLLQRSYVSEKCSLNVPITFARRSCRYIGSSSLTLRTENGKAWSVRCVLGKTYSKITSGWKDFAVDNGLKVGDACIFEAAKNNLWNVFIFRS